MDFEEENLSKCCQHPIAYGLHWKLRGFHFFPNSQLAFGCGNCFYQCENNQELLEKYAKKMFEKYGRRSKNRI